MRIYCSVFSKLLLVNLITALPVLAETTCDCTGNVTDTVYNVKVGDQICDKVRTCDAVECSAGMTHYSESKDDDGTKHLVKIEHDRAWSDWTLMNCRPIKKTPKKVYGPVPLESEILAPAELSDLDSLLNDREDLY